MPLQKKIVAGINQPKSNAQRSYEKHQICNINISYFCTTLALSLAACDTTRTKSFYMKCPIPFYLWRIEPSLKLCKVAKYYGKVCQCPKDELQGVFKK